MCFFYRFISHTSDDMYIVWNKNDGDYERDDDDDDDDVAMCQQKLFTPTT